MICDRIHPSVGDYINISSVVVASGALKEDDLLAFVIEIKPGITAYQAFDKLYYLRTGSSSLPMEDKDIRLRMFSVEKPICSISVKIDSQAAVNEKNARDSKRISILKEYDGDSTKIPPDKLSELTQLSPPDKYNFRLCINLKNVGFVTIRECLLEYSLSPNAKHFISVSSGQEYLKFLSNDQVSESPLFPESIKCVKDIQISVWRNLANESINPNDYEMIVKVFHDNAPASMEKIDIHGLVLEELRNFDS